MTTDANEKTLRGRPPRPRRARRAPAEGPASEIVALRGELSACQAQANEMADKYRRSVAEFANYRKRQERDQEQQSPG